MNADGRTTSHVEETREFEVKPGYDSNTVVTLSGAGN